jgi:hypothetical protein
VTTKDDPRSGGQELPRGKRRPPKPPIVRLNILDLPENEVAWIMGRAGQLDEILGIEWPRYSYLRLARLFRERRRIEISRYALRRLVVRLDPELARRRGDPYFIALLTRKNCRTSGSSDSAL